MNLITIIILFAALLVATILGNVVAYKVIKRADEKEEQANMGKMAMELLANTQTAANG